MLAFCGQDKCSSESSGRIKLSQRAINDFAEQSSGKVVLRCLPEGALAVYPENIYMRMRQGEPDPAERAASSLLFRRTLRQFGALSQPDKISAQGRITIPQAYREHGGIKASSEVVVVGVEIGIEIWSPERWSEELKKVNEHILEKGEREMAADLVNRGN